MSLQLEIYNRRMAARWADVATKSGHELFGILSVGTLPPHEISFSCDSDRPLDSVIDTLERLLPALKEKRAKGGTASGIILPFQ